MRTYCYYLRHNVKTFFTLLQILQSELERVSEGDDVTRTDGSTSSLSDKITAVARRVLPGLRLYSTWFTRMWRVLDAGVADTLTTVEVQELWKAYAGTLTLLASSFPSSQLPEDNYMLEEDVETFGFQPLVAEETMVRWYYGNALKAKYSDLERNHPNVEMLVRVRDLLFDGLALTQIEEAPLVLDGVRFIYQEAGLPSELLASPNHRASGSPPVIPEASNVPLFAPQQPIQADDQQSFSARAPSETASTTLARESAMNQMVDDLVGADDGLDPLPEEDEDIPPTPPEQTFEDTVLKNGQYGVGFVGNPVGSINIADLVKSVQNYRPTGSPAPATPLLAVPMDRRGSSSSFRQPAALPSVPNGDSHGNSIWNPSYGSTPGPSSPYLNGRDARGSPNGMRNSFGHTRADSSASLGHTEWSNGNTHLSSFARPAPGGIGNGAAWGNPTANMHAPTYANGYGYVQHLYAQNAYANPTDVNLASSLLFRGGSMNSEFERAHSSFGRTPPNGQAG